MAASENLHDAIKASLIDREDDFGEQTMAQCSNVSSCVRASLESALAKAIPDSSQGPFMELATLLLNVCKYLKDPAVQVLKEHFRLAELVLLVHNKTHIALSKGMSEAEYMKHGSALIACAKTCESSGGPENSVCHKNLQAVRDEAEVVLGTVREAISDSVKTAVNAASEKIKDITGGVPEGKSWKESISGITVEDPWSEVVKAAQPLLEGDTGHLVQGFRALKQD